MEQRGEEENKFYFLEIKMKNNIFSRKLIAFPRREMYDAMNDNNNNM